MNIPCQFSQSCSSRSWDIVVTVSVRRRSRILVLTGLNLPDCLHGLLPGPFLLSYSVFVGSFSLIFVSVPYARSNSPSRQLLSACKSTVSYRIVDTPNAVTTTPNRQPQL